jgi:hypothetical protein
MLFSLAALVEQHPSKLVLHSLAGALTLSINTMTQIEQISCSHNKKIPQSLNFLLFVAIFAV